MMCSIADPDGDTATSCTQAAEYVVFYFKDGSDGLHACAAHLSCAVDRLFGPTRRKSVSVARIDAHDMADTGEGERLW
ncbi:hypothetical protein CF165_08820 [Amycolatopsis vastitatis]|uniref:Uncharacterized protein n=1 Tax=Amycolatopsis vastitatis TaxID=1905142 RepID=A0A229TF73_9PSEU|nr:hypothetical protein CF165_08820 [Amycolatopsis vastitatis]